MHVFMSCITVVYPWSELNIVTQYLNFTSGILTTPMMHNHIYFIEQNITIIFGVEDTLSVLENTA